MLFQIEEPDGGPIEQDGTGLALGIDLCGPDAIMAVAVGGNAEILKPREGVALPATTVFSALSGDALEKSAGDLLRELRRVAEQSLARPVTHAVIVAPVTNQEMRLALQAAAAAAGLILTRLVMPDDASGDAVSRVLAAAVAAEDDALTGER